MNSSTQDVAALRERLWAAGATILVNIILLVALGQLFASAAAPARAVIAA